MTKSPQRLLNLLLLVAIATASTYWILQFATPGDTQEKLVAVPTADRSPRTQAMNIAPIAGLFGSSVTAGPGASNIVVVGVIAEGGKSEGVALLSVDNQPAMAFRAGQAISADSSLQRVTENGVIVEMGGSAREILLPARQRPAGIDPVR
jgi:hypothetical protein